MKRHINKLIKSVSEFLLLDRWEAFCKRGDYECVMKPIENLFLKMHPWFVMVVGILLLLTVLNLESAEEFAAYASSRIWLITVFGIIFFYIFYFILMKKKVIASFIVLMTLIWIGLSFDVVEKYTNFKILIAIMTVLASVSLVVSILKSVLDFFIEVKCSQKFKGVWLNTLFLIGLSSILIAIFVIFSSGLKGPIFEILSIQSLPSVI